MAVDDAKITRITRKIELPALGRQLRMEDALEKHVAEFAGKRVHVAPVEGVEGLVRLLEQEGPKCLVRLLAVPGAPAR